MFVIGMVFIVMLVYSDMPLLPTAGIIATAQLRSKHGSHDTQGLFASHNGSIHLWTVYSKNNEPTQSNVRIERLQLDRMINGVNGLLLDDEQTVVLEQSIGIATQFVLVEDLDRQMALLSYSIEDEDMKYSVRIYKVDSDVSSVHWNIPGTLSVTRISFSNGQMVYVRKQDQRLFRMLPPVHQIDNSNVIKSIPGPLSHDFVGRVLGMVSVYSRNPRESVVFVFQYIPPEPNSIVFQVKMSLFHRSQDGVWTQHVLWKQRLQGIHDNNIMSEEVERFYFLSKPVIASCGPVGQHLAFVFAKAVFSLDFIDSSTAFGFELSQSPISGIYGKSFEVNDASMAQGAMLLTLCNEYNELIFLKRAVRTGTFVQVNRIATSIFGWIDNMLDFVGFDSDSVFAREELTREPIKHHPSSTFSDWRTLSSWESHRTSIKSITVLDKPEIILALLDNDRLVLLDIDKPFSLLNFVVESLKRRFPMLSFLVGVVAMFSVNEYRWADAIPNGPNGFLIKMAYSLFLIVFLSIIFDV